MIRKDLQEREPHERVSYLREPHERVSYLDIKRRILRK